MIRNIQQELDAIYAKRTKLENYCEQVDLDNVTLEDKEAMDALDDTAYEIFELEQFEKQEDLDGAMSFLANLDSQSSNM